VSGGESQPNGGGPDAAQYSLGALAEASFGHEEIVLDDTPTADLLTYSRAMRLIRRCEEIIGDMVASHEVLCPCHLAIGQEACAVGVATALRSTDRAFGAHRSHGHFLSMGGTPRSLLAEVLGRVTGCSGGMGGSMHLIAREAGLMGTVPIVGATIPMAVGAALAATLEGSDSVGVSYLGDGATEEGVFHESMNLASVMKLPVLFVCEHNLFSSHLHISLRQPASRLSRYADAHRIPSSTIDGNDVVAVARVAHAAAARARRGEGPSFLELVTYRWRGHVGPNEDTDVGVKRSDDLTQWKRRDPIRRLEHALMSKRGVTSKQIELIGESVELELQDALSFARGSPYPDLSATAQVLFSSSIA
jgi:TPP-dependent pyruvate/acetoin dehydrogenase alpha subunit